MNSPLIKNIDLFLDDKPNIYALREKAKTALNQTGFPNKKTEEWKYTPVNQIIRTDFNIDTSEHQCTHHCHDQQTDTSFIEIHFCKGKLHIEEFNTPKGLSITPLPLILYENEHKNYIFNSFNLNKHPFAALNGMYLEQGLCIYVEKNTKISKPIIITYKQDDCSKLQLNIHNIIIMEKDTQMEIVENFLSNDSDTYLINTVNEIYLHTNALLTHYKRQKENANAYHIALNAVKQQKNSTYKQYYLATGAKLSRNETLINLEQTNAVAEVYSAYITPQDGLTDITTNINHLTNDTYSNQYAKAILKKNATATFQGKIYIAPNAIKSNGNQLHKALYENLDATLYCKPELEIYADDVKCSHGASCGEIDKEQLFYLTSRGINKSDAKRMLTNAHLEEILSLLPNKDIKDLFFTLD